ncbi:uncharacterized protein LOC126701039 [Quercus robur]|uniref:uncharacterized protein LOC126701039 n=1 Tax=Quercus robur TaxID=38942 RepID=UPI002161EC16|nr:uncharacterized protein LOC126701039 [Quercus robur]
MACGCGRTIRVFANKWLPGNNGSRILSPNNSLPSTCMVSDVIDHDSRDWNYHLIDASFAPVEASLIKAIPLSALPQKDLLYWPLERFGDYTVKSGYKMLCEESRREEAASSNREASKALWRGIWKTSTPGKVKHFLWKACSNALPVKLNLVKRKFLEEDVCQLIDLFATTAWFIWCRRNKVRLNEPVIPLNKIADEALHYLRTYRNGHSKEKRKTPRGKIKWSPPPSGMFKTNFDSAVFEESGEAGIGVVIRNSAGEVMASLSEKIPLPATVEAVEMLAARRAVRFVQEVGLAESIFEGDSQSVILALQRNTMVNSGIGHLVKDVLSSVTLFGDGHSLIRIGKHWVVQYGLIARGAEVDLKSFSLVKAHFNGLSSNEAGLVASAPIALLVYLGRFMPMVLMVLLVSMRWTAT